jgi:hypothetical protein
VGRSVPTPGEAAHSCRTHVKPFKVLLFEKGVNGTVEDLKLGSQSS